MARADERALCLTTKLVDFLAEVTDAAGKDPVRDILAEEGAPELVIWLDRLPEGIRFRDQADDDVLLRVRPPAFSPEPRPPAELAGWVDSMETRGFEGRAPELVKPRPADAAVDELPVTPPGGVVREFERWSATWRRWSDDQRRSHRRRALYDQLENAAKTLEQRDDEFELVLAAGLLRWVAPDGERIRRHLLTEPIVARLDRHTAEVRVSRASGKRRMEDKEVLGNQEGFQPDRGRQTRAALVEPDESLLGERIMADLADWLALSLGCHFQTDQAVTETAGELPGTPVLSASPALVFRPRSRVLLAEAYKRIAAVLREPGVEVPVSLAQLVVDTEVQERQRWLREQGAVSGDVLGADPLFPLPTNEEQDRVIELLRTETGVVVQGPPGTGKTHTIANLVCALLASGQRVLVTSEKDQALRVLRDKIPEELRRLCVLLAGGSKDAAKELEQGLDALSNALALEDKGSLRDQAKRLAVERDELRRRGAELNNRIRELRDVENVRYEPIVPGFSTTSYRGILTEIVHEVKQGEAKYGWIPAVPPDLPDVPPLPPRQMIELCQLIRTDTPARRFRASQQIPNQDELPTVVQLGHIAQAEQLARDTAHQDATELTRQLAGTGPDRLAALHDLHKPMQQLLTKLGFDEAGQPATSTDWVVGAVSDRLADRRGGLWARLHGVADVGRLQKRLRTHDIGHKIDIKPIDPARVGTARGWLNSGRKLHDFLLAGGKLRKHFSSKAQKDAADFLAAVQVDGTPPDTVDRVGAALDQLEVEIATAQLVGMWAQVGVEVAITPLAVTLAELEDCGRLLQAVESLAALRTEIAQILGESTVATDLSSADQLARLLAAVPAAQRYVELERARSRVVDLHRRVHDLADHPDACPELASLATAIAHRDPDGYARALGRVEIARAEQEKERRRGQLERTLGNVHPALLDLLRTTMADAAWDERLAALPAAWAWSKAHQFVADRRNADEERLLVLKFDQIEERINRVTAQLAGTEAMLACLDRMTDTHARALRSYREHMGHVGAGTGKKTREFRKAARAAMEKAKDAVPAWVVPLPNLLENIAPKRHAFDVVIVDEASQVGLENLFLLWMAPRIIVVGDDKQCTPGQNRMGQLDPLFQSLHDHLAEIDEDVRLNFTSKSNLYGLLSARSGKDAVVRLREHFRCMPEIINWSSSQFYGENGVPGLIPLRERTAHDLDPLKVVEVTGAYTEGRDARQRNPVEAKCIVDHLVQCLQDPRYEGKTFGVVVLKGSGQVALLDHEINAAVTPEQRQERKIRVGSPPNFQGDDRDVIFLSLVVAAPPTAQAASIYRQAYNVAASRAKDQMWLFTSVRGDQLKPDDLRSSLLEYMRNPPSVYGISPPLGTVSATQPCVPFDSLFEQRVFREIRRRGYHVVPQYKVGTRSLDLVVVGDGGRLAVECDGHCWHTSPTQQMSDARRDRELRRMGWDVVRIRESEFEFDPERELVRVWTRLNERGINPRVSPPTDGPDWTPITLPSTENLEDSDGTQGAEL